MRAKLGAAIDRLALRAMERVYLLGRRPSRRRPSGSQRLAFELYSDPALVADPDRAFPLPPPAERATRRVVREVDGGRVESIRFPSDHATLDSARQAEYDADVENRTVHVRALLHAEPRPAVICLHAWMSGRPAIDARVLEARLLHEKRGLDVYLMTMPFHGARAPRRAPVGGTLFPSTSVMRTAEGFRQAVADARRLRALALEAGSASVGLVGMSLGGYTVALLSGLDARWSFAIPIIPMVSMADTLWDHGEGRPERAAAEEQGVTRETLRAAFAMHCPLSHPLKLPRSRVAIVAGRGDRVCPREHVERLWEHWGRPELSWFAGGHILQLGRSGAVARALAAVLL
ncbi:MAG: hypothetical protein HYY06_06460 [Deltaproteobacteria bacterium]|nr:hypothetical protein [Deltaproteobacteria bacterium]